MMDPTAKYFDALGRRGHEDMLHKVAGTLRFDLAQGDRDDHYLVTVKKGDIAVSHRNAEADAVIRTDRSVFDAIASGEANAMAALLRGTLGLEGDAQLLVLFQRLFPEPARSRDQGDGASGKRRKS